MDDRRFDTLTRLLARPSPRRQALASVVAAVVPLTTAAKPEPAKCLAQGKRCSQPAGDDARHGRGKHGGKGGKGKHHPPSCSKCCSRFGAAGSDGKARCACKPEGEECNQPAQCCGGLCRNGTCTKCPDDLVACNGNCVDLNSNGQHCGDCATACADGQRCVGGACVCDETSCPRGCCAKDGSCQRGTDDQACGVGGAECQTCGTCATCDGTTCVNVEATCCGDAAVCQGGTCVACGDGQRCRRGACVCDATSCPNGCCAGERDTCGDTCGCEHGLVCDGGCCACQPPPPNCPEPCEGPQPTTEGCGICASQAPSCNLGQPYCSSSADCAADAACFAGVPGNTCGVPGANGVCITLCGS